MGPGQLSLRLRVVPERRENQVRLDAHVAPRGFSQL